MRTEQKEADIQKNKTENSTLEEKWKLSYFCKEISSAKQAKRMLLK